MTHVVLEFLSPHPLKKDAGRALLELWRDLLPEYFPDRCGNSEPIRHPMDTEHIEEALTFWAWPFLARRRKAKVNCAVFMRHPKNLIHSTFKLDVPHDSSIQGPLLEFLKKTCTEFEADLGLIHPLTQHEIVRGKIDGTIESLNTNSTLHSFYITTHQLRKNLPNLYWATVFGPAYVAFFGRDKLLTSPAPHVAPLTENSILIRLSDNLSDLESDFATVDQSRQVVKEHLDSNAFFDSKQSALYAYNVPEFVWK